jgi:hypothetical protein
MQHYTYICRCGGGVGKKLTEDGRGVHTYIWACTVCHREFGCEWAEYHPVARARSARRELGCDVFLDVVPPLLDLAPWPQGRSQSPCLDA